MFQMIVFSYSRVWISATSDLPTDDQWHPHVEEEDPKDSKRKETVEPPPQLTPSQVR